MLHTHTNMYDYAENRAYVDIAELDCLAKRET